MNIFSQLLSLVKRLLSLVKRSPQIRVEELKPGKETEKVSPEAVMAIALLKACIEQKPIDVEGISGLFIFNPAVKCLTADSHIALRRVSSGGVPGRGVYSEDVEGFVGRLACAGYASYGDNGTIRLMPDGPRICFLILLDEAKSNLTGLEALTTALDFKIGDLLRCFDEKWLK